MIGTDDKMNLVTVGCSSLTDHWTSALADRVSHHCAISKQQALWIPKYFLERRLAHLSLSNP